MGPGTHDQPLRRPVLPGHGRIVASGGDGEGIVPTAAVGARDVGVAPEVLLEIVALKPPELVVSSPAIVVQQGLFQVGDLLQGGAARLERRPPDPVSHPLHSLQHPLPGRRVVPNFLGVISVQEECAEHVELHGSAPAHLVGVAVCGADVGPDGPQVGRAVESHVGLDQGQMGAAHGAHSAVGPGLGRNPLHRVESVGPGRFVYRVEILAGALGTVSAAQVLQHQHETSRGEVVGHLVDEPFRLLVVGGAHQQGRKGARQHLSIPGRPVDVGGQAHPVPHGDHQILEYGHLVGLGSCHQPGARFFRIRLSWLSTSAIQPGWMTVVESSSTTTAGPSIPCPGSNR